MKRPRLRGLIKRALGRAASDSTADAKVPLVPPNVPKRPAPIEPPVDAPSALGSQELGELVASTGHVIVHHWATWCDACVEELPLIDGMVQALPSTVTLVGLSWDPFMGVGLDAAAATVARFERARSAPWSSRVVSHEPEALVAQLDLPVSTVPQTAVYLHGERLQVWPGPMSEEDVAELLQLVGA